LRISDSLSQLMETNKLINLKINITKRYKKGKKRIKRVLLIIYTDVKKWHICNTYKKMNKCIYEWMNVSTYICDLVKNFSCMNIYV